MPKNPQISTITNHKLFVGLEIAKSMGGIRARKTKRERTPKEILFFINKNDRKVSLPAIRYYLLPINCNRS